MKGFLKQVNDLHTNPGFPLGLIFLYVELMSHSVCIFNTLYTCVMNKQIVLQNSGPRCRQLYFLIIYLP